MNEHFVNVKVDREERPDLDAVYMDAVVALTGHGGWPMTVFLTPDGRAVLRRHVLPARAAPRAAELPAGAARRSRPPTASGAPRWPARRRQLVEAMRSSSEVRAVVRAARPIRCCRRRPRGLAPRLRRRVRRLRRRAEVPARLGARVPAPPRRARTWSGRRSTRWPPAGCTTSSAAASTATRWTADWLVPHFEKMLYDNALLVPAYLHAWVVTGRRALPPRRRGDVRLPAPRPRASRGRLRLVAGRRHRRRRGAHVHLDGGRGRPGRAAPPVRARPLDHPRRARPGAEGAAARRALAPAAAGPRRQGDRRLERPGPRRPGRSRPPTRARRPCYTPPRGSGASCSAPLSSPDGRLFRTWRDGRASIPGYLEDYADVAHGLYELHVATGELRWLEESSRLARLAVELFADEERGGFFMTAHDAEQLVARKKDLDDNPVPVGELDARVRAAAARADLRRRRARAPGSRRPATAARQSEPDARPPSAGRSARSTCTSPRRASWRSSATPADEIARAALAPFDPNAVVAFGPSEDVPLLAGKTRVDGKPTLYVCERFACRAPVT